MGEDLKQDDIGADVQKGKFEDEDENDKTGASPNSLGSRRSGVGPTTLSEREKLNFYC
jgi:hypothetical protein